ncbi:MAG: O-antigen ligase C-terminal domain-containing protein [Burkholderiales bacterium]|nr:O-antigen ligase C-terminal domain-containing protein [Burkholderiales bacterium]
MPTSAPQRTALLAAAIAAAAAPSLLAYNVAPSPTFLNQALAFALWAVFVVVTGPTTLRGRAAPLYAALLLLTGAVAQSWLFGALAAPLALSAIATLAAAAVVAAGGCGVRADAEDVFAAFCWGWVVAGGFSVAIAAIQVFAPGIPDGEWLAISGIAGRAVGNLRQPNHLSSLLLWSCIAVIGLLELGRLGPRATRWAAALMAAFVFAVVLSASRTGLVSVLMLALWGALDRRLSRPARRILIGAPLAYALAWFAMAGWATLSQHAFGGEARLAETDISSSRFGIWRDTLALIRMYPWTGVGWGEFNLAWTLTPFPHRPTAFFDHTHNLLLQFAVELGLPMAALLTALLVWALLRAALQAWATPGGLGAARRCAVLMVLMIAVHSQLEYPLWYSYFLLPTAWALGFALQGRGAAVPALPSRLLAVAALVVIGATALSLLDYRRVTLIFDESAGATPLEARIASGQRSLFFGHHADYAAVTTGVKIPGNTHGFDRAVHYLLDTRLMIAWAEALNRSGRVDLARDLAARLREFRKSDAAEFFAPCPSGATPVEAAKRPFQCELPERVHDWREFLAPGATAAPAAAAASAASAAN